MRWPARMSYQDLIALLFKVGQAEDAVDRHHADLVLAALDDEELRQLDAIERAARRN